MFMSFTLEGKTKFNEKYITASCIHARTSLNEEEKAKFSQQAKILSLETKKKRKEALETELGTTLDLQGDKRSAAKPTFQASWCDGRLLDVHECLGYGTYGEVYMVKDKLSGAEYCLKIAKRSAASDIEHEMEVARNLGNHPNVVLNYGPAMASGSGTCFGMMLEKCDSNLRAWLQTTPLSGDDKISSSHAYLTRWRFLAQAASGLAHLHKREILHGDVKSCNMLITMSQLELRIADLGCSHYLKNGKVEVKGCQVYASMYRPLECLAAGSSKAGQKPVKHVPARLTWNSVLFLQHNNHMNDSRNIYIFCR